MEPLMLGLPSELIEEILGIAARTSTWDEKPDLLSLSKGTYKGVFCSAYRFIRIPRGPERTSDSEDQFRAFAAWVESKPPTLVRTAIQALRLTLKGPGDDPTIWRRLFQKLAGLKMLTVYCSSWSDTGGCLSTVWDSLFRLPNLERLHLDWHMNSLTLPSPHESPLYALRNLTHLTIFPYVDSLPLDFLHNFEALIYLVIFNPSLGYTRESVASLEASLPQLHVLLLIFTEVEYDRDQWLFDQSNTVVTLHRGNYSFDDDEYEKELNGEDTIWKEGKVTLAEKIGIQGK
ncbi:hypothetical protein DL96DRAFT_1089716 [Flagelloscypha sp. PMI_526]|nr:hypothetical protein DL96DRAFT_1089716 [Flagelloscypha sp. PMI_526]